MNFKAKSNTDLSMHLKTKHRSQYPCEKCSYKAFNAADLNRHTKGMHNAPEHTYSRYFNRSKNQNMNIKSATQENKKKEDIKMPVFNASSMKKQNESEKTIKCVGKCNSIHKTFSHEDELELHMKFFHKDASSSQPQ